MFVRRGAPRYVTRVLWRRFFLAIVVLVLAGSLGGCCDDFPPAMTGITLSPSDAKGAPDPVRMSRTRLQPPIPVIAARPGSDPAQSALFLNEPSSGRIAVTLARGTQSFLLFTSRNEQPPPYVVAIFLEHETSPAFTALLDSPAAALRRSPFPTVMGLDGVPVPNTSDLSVERRGFRVTLRRAEFPLAGTAFDTIGPWQLSPDNVVDAVGIVTMQVDPL
jgi:hypothetical protein